MRYALVLAIAVVALSTSSAYADPVGNLVHNPASGPVTFISGGQKCVIANGWVYCDLGFRKTPVGSQITGLYLGGSSPQIMSTGTVLATFNSGTGNIDAPFGFTAAVNAGLAMSSSGTGWWENNGTTSAALQAFTPTAGYGGQEYDDTNLRWRDYEGTNWNFRVTVNADGGLPLIKPVAETSTQIELLNGALGLSVATDRSFGGAQLMWGNTARATQVGGGLHWALEERSLTINPFHEQAYCPRCTECSGTTATAFDAQTCTDAAAGGTTVVDAVDFRTFVTAASSGSVSSWTSRVAETRRNQFPHMVWTGMTTGVASRRIWYGLGSVALNGSDTPVGHIAAWRFSTAAGDTKWQYCTGDGATTTCLDSGVSVIASHLYHLEVDCRHPSATYCIFTVQDRNTGVPASFTKATNLPTATTNMSPRHYCESLTTAAATCGVGPSVLETL